MKQEHQVGASWVRFLLSCSSSLNSQPVCSMEHCTFELVMITPSLRPPTDLPLRHDWRVSTYGSLSLRTDCVSHAMRSTSPQDSRCDKRHNGTALHLSQPARLITRLNPNWAQQTVWPNYHLARICRTASIACWLGDFAPSSWDQTRNNVACRCIIGRHLHQIIHHNHGNPVPQQNCIVAAC